MDWNRMDGNGKQGHEHIAKINLKQHWDRLSESEQEMLNGKVKSVHVSHRDEFESASTKLSPTKNRQHKRVDATQK